MIERICEQCGGIIARPLYPSTAAKVRFCDNQCRWAWYAAERIRRAQAPRPTEGVKVCTKCAIERPVTEFEWDKRAPDCLDDWCRECLRAYRKAWRIANPEKVRRYHFSKSLRLRNRISLKQYEALVLAQGGKCAICGALTGRGSSVRLYVDHDHASDVVRGLLCQRCNSGLGLLGDTVEVVRAALAYLEKGVVLRMVEEER